MGEAIGSEQGLRRRTTVSSWKVQLVRELTRNLAVLTDVDKGYQGLGFRGVIIEPTEDTVAERFDLPAAFRIAGGSSPNEAKAQEIAERLIRGLAKRPSTDDVAYDQALEDKVLDLMSVMPNIEYGGEPDPVAQAAAADVTCFIEQGAFNPDFWNHPDYIRRNNCYNYASNKRTNTFAQPGRASGHPITTLSCADVTRAALSDGLHRRFDCFPDSEKPRWFVALVVAPGWDYHWYRKQKEGFWGHKPGGTAARNTDNNGAIIYNPETAARLPYTDFCGYFYVPKSQRIN